MTLPSQETIDIIATQIRLDAREALNSLIEFNRASGNSAAKIEGLAQIIKTTASQMGGDFNRAEAAVKTFANSLTKIKPAEVSLAGAFARGQSKQYSDFIKELNTEQGKTAFAGAQKSNQLLSAEQALIAARERENILIEQAGQKLSRQLIAQQKLSDQKNQEKILSAEQKVIAAREREEVLIDQAGKKLSDQLLAQQRLADATAQQKSQLPQNIIPSFVKQQFGDINSYIAQSSDKVAAWKNVVTQSAKAAGVSFEKAGAELKNMVSGTTVAPLNTALKQLGNDGRSAFQKLIDGAHFARIALGALVSMLLFQAIQAVTTFFTGAVEQAKKFEDTLYRLQNAERALSMEGVEVSLKGLKQGIIDIQKLFPIFSKEDVASLVGTLSVSTKQLKLNEQQILDLAKAIAVLNIRSEKQEDIQTTAQHVLSSLLTGNAKGISALGIAFTDNTMSAKAMEMEFLKAGESLSNLSENEKGLVKLALLLESTGQELEGVGEYLETNSAKLQQNKAAWADLQTTVGQIILPFIPALTEFINLLNDGFTVGKVLIIEFMTALGTLGVVATAVFTGQIKSIKDFTNIVKTSIEAMRTGFTNQFFKEVPDDAPDWFMRGWGNRIEQDAETATGAFDDMYASAEDSEDAEKALAEIDEKIQDIILDAKQAQDDLDLKLGQKQEDLDLEYTRKGEDAARDHAQKLEDINTDAAQKAEDAKRKVREDELKAERDLLQKLKELRDKYLLDLEEALHKRDARQVLRLMKEYKLDKQHILEKARLDEEQRKKDLAAELAQIELERQRRIQDENIEYQRKLADLAEAKAREQEELQIWYKREQDDIARNVEQKLQKLLNGYIAEGKIHESQQAEIQGILAKYFAEDMAMVDRLANYMATRFAQMNASAASFTPAVPGSLNYSVGLPDMSNPFSGNYKDPLESTGKKGGRKMAEGGTFIANRPTSAIFGEKGPEMASFTPLDRTGRDVGKLFGNIEGQGSGSNILVEVELSPDLEARVVKKSMDEVGNVISSVNRRKK